jgi:4-coumarate--CoA ligase
VTIHPSHLNLSVGLIVTVLLAAYRGCEVIVMAKFDLENFCRTIETKKVTYLAVAPPICVLLAKSPVPTKYDLSSLKRMISGAAPMTQELMALVRERYGVILKQGYGCSEITAGAVAQVSPTHNVEDFSLWLQSWKSLGKPYGSVGGLLPNQTAKIVDDAGREVADGQAGELWLKGPNVFKGYFNDPVKTAESFSKDDFYMTGDICYQDGDSNIWITDRKKELIKYNGFQVAPAELEGLLLSHPKVSDVAVVGVWNDDRSTEEPRAYVVVAPGAGRNDQTTTEIHKWLQTRVANQKRLRGGIRYVDAVPKSASGKILRNQLRELMKQEAAASETSSSKL